MKKIINDPNSVVQDMLRGIQITNNNVLYDEEGFVIYRSSDKRKVAIVSGGGTGHEPAHAGFVGLGMLDAAVCGNVFASPSPDRILRGIKLADKGKGVLLVIKNYAGDLMNFEIAEEIARDEGYKVDHVIVKDDVAVEDEEDSTGRRGILGTVFVHKIAGAKAEHESSLEDVKRIAEKVIKNVRSFGISLSSCTIPAVGSAGFTVRDNMMEVGMGIHGEPGIEELPIGTSREIAKIMIDRITNDLDFANSEVAVIINGLGGTPLMELNILAADVHDELIIKKIKPIKYYVGNFMTAIEMAGASCSILKLDDELKSLLLEPSYTSAFREG